MNANKLMPLLLALACSQAFAGTTIDQTRALDAHASVDIHNVSGAVNISAWSRPQIRITGTLGEGARGLDIEGNAQNLSITVQGPKNSGWFNWGNDASMGPTTLNVTLPSGVSLKVKTVSAPITIAGLQGGKLQLNSVSGRAHVDVKSPDLDIATVSGNIDVSGHVEHARLVTVSGDILAHDIGSELSLQTVSGELRAVGGPFRKASVSTVSGDVELSGGLTASGHLDIDSMSGDVRLNLPAPWPADISAKSFSGSIRSDIGKADSASHGPGSELDAHTANGRGSVHVETFSGDLRIRQRDDH